MRAPFPWRADIFNMTAAPRKVSEERMRILVRVTVLVVLCDNAFSMLPCLGELVAIQTGFW